MIRCFPAYVFAAGALCCCSASELLAGQGVFDDLVHFDLTSSGAPATANSTDQLFADIGMIADWQFTDILITGDAGSGEQTFSAVSDLGLSPILLPSGTGSSVAYDTNFPGMFPVPPIVDAEFPHLGSTGSFHYTIEYQPDLSTGPEFTGTGSISIQATSLGSFEFGGETYSTTAIGATGIVIFVTIIPTPGSAALSACLLVGFATRRRR